MADQEVAAAIAGEVDCPGKGFSGVQSREVLKLFPVRYRIAEARDDGVDTHIIDVIDDHVLGDVHIVGVAACPTVHCVDTPTAVQPIVTDAAGQAVVVGTAVEGVVALVAV